jgi:hypothetical protein
MPSAHYKYVTSYINGSMECLTDAVEMGKTGNEALQNMSKALLELSDAMQDEFIYLNTRLTYIEQQLAKAKSE